MSVEIEYEAFSCEEEYEMDIIDDILGELIESSENNNVYMAILTGEQINLLEASDRGNEMDDFIIRELGVLLADQQRCFNDISGENTQHIHASIQRNMDDLRVLMRSRLCAFSKTYVVPMKMDLNNLN